MAAHDKIAAYINALPEARQEPMRKIRAAITENLPDGFVEVFAGTPSYVVPLSIYEAGYHCSPGKPLPFISFASMKNFIALYHFGLYADPALLNWFVAEYPKHSKNKLDMGKSCIRFKKLDEIPVALIGQLAAQRTVAQWLFCYENGLNRN